jgi:hypothetical protein
LAIITSYPLYNLIVLKFSYELVEGNIERIESRSYKNMTFDLICSYTYKGKIFNREIEVGRLPYDLISVSKKHPLGKTIFMLNTKKDIVFPQDNINMEILQYVLILIIWILLLLFSIKETIKNNVFKKNLL